MVKNEIKDENQEIKKRKYEIAFILKTENVSVISQSLISRKFIVLAENPLEKVRLAYPIKKETYAFFGYSYFEGNPADIKNLKGDLKLIPEILRYVIITPPFVKKNFEKTFNRKPAPVKPSEETKFTLPTGQVLPDESILTNEALEKKIEEILK